MKLYSDQLFDKLYIYQLYNYINYFIDYEIV